MSEWLEIKDIVKAHPKLVEASLRRKCNQEGAIPDSMKRQVPWGRRTKWQIHQGALPLLLKDGDERTQYKEVLTEWKREIAATKSPRTLDTYTFGLRSFWRNYHGNPEGWEYTDEQPLNAFTVENIRKVVTLAPKKGNIHLACRCFYTFLVRKGLRSKTDLDEFKEFKPSKNKNPKRTFLKRMDQDGRSDLEKLLECNELWTERRTRYDRVLTAALLNLGYHTGLRNTEICDLTLSAVDLENRIIYVFKGKGDQPRRVGMRPELYQALKEYLKKRPDTIYPHFFVQKNGKPYNRFGLLYRIKALGAQAGIKIKPHGLRTSLTTHLLMDGEPVALVQKILGHKKITTTQFYDMTTDEDALDLLRGPMAKPQPYKEPELSYSF